MNVKVTLRTKEAFNRLFTKDVRYYANSRVQAYSDIFVPFGDGNLSQDVTITDEAVTYNRNYAHYMYEGELYLAPNGSAWAKKGEKKNPTGKPLNYSKDVHPLATSKWDRAMAVAKGQQIAEDIQNYIERRN